MPLCFARNYSWILISEYIPEVKRSLEGNKIQEMFFKFPTVHQIQGNHIASVRSSKHMRRTELAGSSVSCVCSFVNVQTLLVIWWASVIPLGSREVDIYYIFFECLLKKLLLGLFLTPCQAFFFIQIKKYCSLYLYFFLCYKVLKQYQKPWS